MTYGLSIGTEVGDLEWPWQRDARRRELSLRQLRFLFRTCTYWVRQCLRYTIFFKMSKISAHHSLYFTHFVRHCSVLHFQSTPWTWTELAVMRRVVDAAVYLWAN